MSPCDSANGLHYNPGCSLQFYMSVSGALRVVHMSWQHVPSWTQGGTSLRRNYAFSLWMCQSCRYHELNGTGSETQQAAQALEYARCWNNSWVDDIFGGLLQSTIECQACGHCSHCFDAFLDLSLPMPSSQACSLQVQTLSFVLHLPSSHCM